MWKGNIYPFILCMCGLDGFFSVDIYFYSMCVYGTICGTLFSLLFLLWHVVWPWPLPLYMLSRIFWKCRREKKNCRWLGSIVVLSMMLRWYSMNDSLSLMMTIIIITMMWCLFLHNFFLSYIECTLSSVSAFSLFFFVVPSAKIAMQSHVKW